MRPAIRKPGDGIGVPQAFRAGRQRVVVEVRQRREDEVGAVVPREDVVGDFLRAAAFPRGHGGDRGLLRRGVVGRVAEGEHALEGQARDQREGAAADAVLGQDAGAEGRVAHRRGALRGGQVRDFLVGRAAGEGVLAALEAEQDADRPRRKHGADRQALRRRRVGHGEEFLPRLRPVVTGGEREEHRRARRLDDTADDVEFGRGVRGVPVGDQFQQPVPGIAQPHGEAVEFFLLRSQGGGRVALQRLVADGAGCGDAEGAGAHRLGDQRAHRRDVVRRRVLEVEAALAHDMHAQRGVRHQGADVDVARLRIQRIEVFGEGFPPPVEALVQDGAGDVLHPFHEFDQLVAVGGTAGGEADAAIAHHRRGHAMPGGGGEVRIPHRLPVVMGVDVHEAGGDDAAAGVDLVLPAG